MKRRKSHSVARQKKLPYILFTVESLYLIHCSLALFEEVLQRNRKPTPRVQLATETLAQVKNKLADLTQGEACIKDLSLTLNELHIINASLQMYLTDLFFEKPSGERARLVDDCRKLCDHFQLLLGGQIQTND